MKKTLIIQVGLVWFHHQAFSILDLLQLFRLDKSSIRWAGS
jgi:hypothetical protein